MKRPTLEEVKEYFKDAMIIKDQEGDSINLSEMDDIGFYTYGDTFFASIQDIDLDVYAWHKDYGYAEIVKYKNKNDFDIIGESITDLLKYKNEKYGQSALNPVNIFSEKTKVGQRLDDKISRIKNSDTLRKNDIADVIGYLFLVCKENEWNNFDEFKD